MGGAGQQMGDQVSATLGLVAAHMVGDYITQTGWMAANKFRCWKARAIHVTCYTAGFAPVVWLAGMTLPAAMLFLALVWATHFIVDCRRWASGEQWPPKPILVDQSIHVATLYLLAVGFGL